jgi:hypothetical protein
MSYSITDLQRQVHEKQKSVIIAKDRADSLRDIDGRTSDYESWFPMGRPLKPYSVPILIGLTIFLWMILLGIVLSRMGMQVQFAFPFIKSPIDLLSSPLLLVPIGLIVVYALYAKFFLSPK